MTTDCADKRPRSGARHTTVLDLEGAELKLSLATLLGLVYLGSFLALAPPPPQAPRASAATTPSSKTASGTSSRAPRIRTRSS